MRGFREDKLHTDLRHDGTRHQQIGVGHPFRTLEDGSKSDPLSHAADEAFRDPKANTKELFGVYEFLRKAVKNLPIRLEQVGLR
jgi:hypothetical protein